ncbi:MAG: hypothetical protein ACK5Z5_08520 [Neisseriaceae bacterium]|jgi:hypothetical protein
MTAVLESKVSTLRTKKFRENKMRNGFKRIQKWVYDINNANLKKQISEDLANYVNTEETKLWDDFALEQFGSIKGWK